MTLLETRGIKGQILLARARDICIPASPQKVRAVLSLCGDRYVSAEKISRVILSDYGLTFKLFRLMNSAFFSVQRKDLLSIRYMVVLLGLENLARAFIKVPLLNIRKKAALPGNIALLFLAEGIFASRMAAALSVCVKCDPEKASVAAMFRNMGEVISSLTIPALTASCVRGSGAVIKEDLFKKLCGGYTPERLGFQLAGSWNLPEVLRLAICPSRFNLKRTDVEKQRLVTLCDLIRELIKGGLSGNKGSKKASLSRKLMTEKLKLKEEQIDRGASRAARELSDQDGFFYEILESRGLFKRLFI